MSSKYLKHIIRKSCADTTLATSPLVMQSSSVNNRTACVQPSTSAQPLACGDATVCAQPSTSCQPTACVEATACIQLSTANQPPTNVDTTVCIQPSTANQPPTCFDATACIQPSTACVTATSSLCPIEPNFQKAFQNWAVETRLPHNDFNKLLEILKKVKTVDELTNLPSDCRTLLKTSTTNSISETDSGHYYHFGLALGLTYALKTQTSDLTINFDINIDGLPLTKSSGSQFWPVLGSLCGNKTPFVIGVWHGFQKPKHPNEVLGPFIKEYLQLKTNGFFYENQRKNIALTKIICDAPAKSFVLCTKGHNAYFGCTKCITEGTYVNNRVCYNDLHSELRTDGAFRDGQYGDDYHIQASPLLQLDIDLIKSIPLDYMHLVCLGVMKRLLQFWVKGKMSVRMNQNDLSNFNQTILDVKNCISSNDFARLPRSSNELDRWKATEFRQILLYTGPITLENKIKSSQYTHFLALSCAIRILCSTTLCIELNNYAKDLLMYFVRNYSKLYGQEYVSYNVHNLIHLADDVLKFGSLENFSAFQYENYMFEIKKCLKSCNMPLQQLINRINEKRIYQSNTGLVKTKSNFIFSHEPLLSNKAVKTYKWVKHLHFKLGTDCRNNHCLIKGDIVVKIVRIIECINTKEMYIVFQRYLSYENCFETPCQSKSVYGGYISQLSDLCEIVNIAEIITKCIHYKNYAIFFVN